MENRFMITTILFMIFLLATPSFSSSKGGSENGGSSSSSSSSGQQLVYEIDYRGPETHPSHNISPPDHSHGRTRRPWIIHHQHHQPKQSLINPLKGSKVGE